MLYYFWKKSTLKKFASWRDKILAWKTQTSLLTDEEIQAKFNYFRTQIQSSSESKSEKLLTEYLVPVFALVREVIQRKIGILLFPTQVFGGIVLHYANIAQMNTGEGKTLTAFLPICLNALTGKSVFVVTVNEYLAQRDWQLAQPIFAFFGLTSGVNLRVYSPAEKQNLYHNHTVIYTTGSGLGFDYLRSNLAQNVAEKTQLNFYYAIIDEVDSILIDEAQNPLIISREAGGKGIIYPKEYRATTELASSLVEKKHYIVDQKEKTLWLTNRGRKKSEKFFQINNLFSFANQRYNFLLHNALKAQHFYYRDVNYIVDKVRQRIVIIDELTGRLVPNRVYGAGIQQAIESKENLPFSRPSKTIATITYQNFFQLFSKLSGMTGTAQSEAEEFRQVYGMEVIVAPPYRQLIRKDHDDLIFWDRESKYRAIIKLIVKNSQTKKRPILIGSPSVETSEHLSLLLAKKGIFHYKLNAVNHQQEAEIIAQAGQIGAVTISTNMAGRGTDIILSEESRKAGGLLVIGVERNTSRRIDNQLRGRSGRQGDPGESQFYVSLEDELVKNTEVKERLGNFFSQRLKEALQRPLSGQVFNFVTSEPQENIRNIHSANRQYVLNYDLLISQQREVVYNYREKLLTSPDPRQIILHSKESQLDQPTEYLRFLLIRKIDNFWSDYLECLERIQKLVEVKRWLPQNPQEAFFWETMTLFQKGLSKLNNNLKKTVDTYRS